MLKPHHRVDPRANQSSPGLSASEDVITITDETVHVCRRLVQHSANLTRLLQSIATVQDGAIRSALCDTAGETVEAMVEILAEHERFMAVVDSAELSNTDLERVANLISRVLTDSRSSDLARDAADLKSRLLPTFQRKGLRP